MEKRSIKTSFIVFIPLKGKHKKRTFYLKLMCVLPDYIRAPIVLRILFFHAVLQLFDLRGLS